MGIYCGIDIIEIDRIRKSIQEMGDIFINKIYTCKEIEYCESKKIQRYQHYAARFAAKEAAFKAVSALCENKYDISWKDIEVTNDKNGRPKVEIKNIEKLNNMNTNIDISISHNKENAIANVVILTK